MAPNTYGTINSSSNGTTQVSHEESDPLLPVKQSSTETHETSSHDPGSSTEIASDSRPSSRASSKSRIDTASLSSLPPADKGKEAYLVLLSCCLLQLPVWGFVISYGVLQEYYTSKMVEKLNGDIEQTGIIGTTLNGVMYLSMPVLFGLFSHRLAPYRRIAAFVGVLLSALSLVASSFTHEVWVLIVTQGVLQAFGSTILYSCSTIYLDEWFILQKGFAYGMIQGIKSLVGVGVPVLFQFLLAQLGFRMTLRIWAAVTVAFATPSLLLLKSRYEFSSKPRRHRPLAWSFLRHRTFYFFQVANIAFSTSYGLPQTYLASFASQILGMESSAAALLLVALNTPSVAASFWFGLLSDGRGLLSENRSISVASASLLSAMGASIAAFLFWGLIPGPGSGGVALLTIFAIVYGFFAGGYSSTWGGVVSDMQREADAHDEAVDTGLLFGLLNGGRGIGFVAGGFVGVQLLKDGGIEGSPFAYGTAYGGVILFTGIGSALGGLSIFCRNKY